MGYRFASFQAVDKSGKSYVFTFSAYGLQATAYWMKSTETRGEAYAEIVDLDDYDLKAARQARHRAAREQGALREAAAHATGLDETAVRHLMMDLVSIDDRGSPDKVNATMGRLNARLSDRVHLVCPKCI